VYNIALVQNQSEMSHYGYADARPFLEEIGYCFVLYTAQNIQELSSDLKRGKFDAVVFASNALNDKTIRDNVMSDDFKTEFAKYLENGKGCLVLHQLRLAQSNTLLKFLPKPLDLVKLVARFSDEAASDGDLYQTETTKKNVCFLYPHSVELSQVKSQCLSFRSLKGLYWHYFENINRSDWDLLLYDVDRKKQERPLLAISKESDPFRVVISALTLDWQKQKRLLQNILTYVVEGRHNTAIIMDPRNTSATFGYFIECLKSEKYPFRAYDIDQDLSDLARNLKAGVHAIVVLDPFVNTKRMGANISALIEQRIKDGELKLIGISEIETGRFQVAGRERFALRILYDLEMQIQKELYETGYIDGSFWSTVESLQILSEIKQVKSEFDIETLRKTFESAKVHDRSGSYDEVFGVTCALFWLRAKFLGKTHPDTERTLAWIGKNLQGYEDRERTLAYFTLVNVGVATKNEKESLRSILIEQQIEHLSEIDLIAYLKAAVAIKAKDVLIPIVKRLGDLQEDGKWVDLATSATAISALLEVLDLLRIEDTTSYTAIRPSLESMISKAIIYLQGSRADRVVNKDIDYPWDNKASTSLKCIQAWLRFEESIDLPVREIIDTLVSYSSVETEKSSAKTALSILEEIKKENRKLSEENHELTARTVQYKRSAYMNKALWVSLLTTMYVLSSIIIYWIRIGSNPPALSIITGTFIDSWPFHLAFIGLIIALLRFLPPRREAQKGTT